MFFTNYAFDMGQMLEIVKGEKSHFQYPKSVYQLAEKHKFRNEKDVKRKGVLDEKIKWYKLK